MVLGFQGAKIIGIYGVFLAPSVSKKTRKHNLLDEF
jgi:hypothetical protein